MKRTSGVKAPALNDVTARLKSCPSGSWWRQSSSATQSETRQWPQLNRWATQNHISRPFKTGAIFPLFPALKRGAIFNRPSGAHLPRWPLSLRWGTIRSMLN